MSFFSLLRDTLLLFRAKFRLLAVGIVLFAMLTAVQQAFFMKQFNNTIDAILGATSSNRQAFDQIMHAGFQDEEGQKFLQELTRVLSADMDAFSPEAQQSLEKVQIMARVMLALLPLILASFLVTVMINFFSYCYYTMAAMEPPTANAYTTLFAVLRKIFPIMGVHLWVALRSFGWLPLVGPFLFLYYAPRMIASPVALLSRDLRPRDSVAASLAATRGKWLITTGNLLGMGLFALLLLNLGSIPVGILALLSPKTSLLLWFFVAQCVLAWVFLFLARLSQKLLEPRL